MSAMDEYLAARAELVQAIDEAKSMAATIARGAEMLSDTRRKVSIVNSGAEVPQDMLLNPAAPTVDASMWPTAKRLVETLVNRERAREKALRAWNAVPAHLRPGLVGLPT